MKDRTRRPRNHLALHPLLHKGGPHGPTRGAERLADRNALRQELQGWGVDSDAIDTTLDLPHRAGRLPRRRPGRPLSAVAA